MNIRPSGRTVPASDFLKKEPSLTVPSTRIPQPGSAKSPVKIPNDKEKTNKEPSGEESGVEVSVTEESEFEDKRKARFYLPVLRINDPSQWEPKPLSERRHFTDEVAKGTCVGNCCGVKNLRAGCCQLDPDDLEHVLGPVDEPWIKKTVHWFRKKGINCTRHDIVIDFEEGKLIGQQFFNNHRIFQQEDSYPILRIQASGVRFACKFLNVQNGMCGIYLNRSDMCKNYLCSYVKANFLVRTHSHPNTYQRLDLKPDK